MAMVEAPIISRINRLDNVVRHLEEMRGGSRRSSWESSSPSPGSPSTCSDGRSSSSQPQESFKHCRPLDDVVSETQHKGTLLYRLSHLEDRVLQLCLQLEKEMEQHMNHNKDQPHTPTKKASFKQLVKSCVKSKSNTK